ncbi:hypothetical protein [Reyranella sp.]|uniref:hypothetical protein n=1 Tax=Reyranella sp. TaxID=1929291 RepID=UPI002F92F3F3
MGGGPGGLGPLLWAAQHGRFEAWLDQGIALVERSGRLGGTLGQYGINSDSLGGSYLECLASAGWPTALQHLRHDPVTLEMERYQKSYPPLPLVNRYMGLVGLAVAEMFTGHPTSALHLHTTAQSVHLCEDGRVAVVVHGQNERPRTLVARSAVVALGGRQHWRDELAAPGLKFVDCAMRQLLSSNELLTHDGLAQANEIIGDAGDRSIVIVGGAHSAYAAAWALLQLPAAASLKDGQIVILQRRPPRIFYPDRATATADDYPFEEGDICVRTQRVNRMGGIRGHGRDIWRQIARKPNVQPESRVAVLTLQDFSATQLRVALEEAALVVPCLGYRSATMPIFDPAGQRLTLKADINGDAVDGDCRLLTADGTPLPNVFGIGLGSGFRPTQAMGCEPNFRGQANSLWMYQNDIGAVIYREIQLLAEERQTAVAA